ncbi:MAG: DUF1801 domain-containing protein [Actinobacteria bacterium]|nr:DUF1801 domain-containing protein [Actinomycetota bacterium]
MHSEAADVDRYVAEIGSDRRETVEAMVDLIRANIPDGFVEAMEFGMPTWVIPLERYGATHNDRPLGVVALANQKRYISLYLMGIYADPNGREAFERRWAESGKKLDMGKSCLRCRTLDDLNLDLLATAIAAVTPEAYLAAYERSRERPVI